MAMGADDLDGRQRIWKIIWVLFLAVLLDVIFASLLAVVYLHKSLEQWLHCVKENGPGVVSFEVRQK